MQRIIWLGTCAVLVYAMVILGGYTRLSHSGLSIVQWKPISGIIPPLSQNAWQNQFELYQQSPEFKKINYSMNLQEFKQIFLVEYAHRVLGRITGLAFLLPFLFFWRRFDNSEKKYFSSILALIALQGFIGWFMVKSGLVDQPSVSQYRLSAHLILACVILILLTYKIFPGKPTNRKHGFITAFLLLLQIASGAFVAGLKAGLVYNTFPLMDGEIIPAGLWFMSPKYLNFFENITMVQFIHRYLALINLINILAYCYKLFNLSKSDLKNCFSNSADSSQNHAPKYDKIFLPLELEPNFPTAKSNRKIAILIAALIITQFILGVLTLLMQAPIDFALLHQGLAIILLLTTIASLKRP